MKIIFREMDTVEEINEFWQKKKQYELEDIFPNLAEKGNALKETVDWFQSDEYYDIIMDLHEHAQPGGQTLKFVFIFDEQINYLGFSMYKIYTEEDGKAFILDFCIEKQYRNQGLGSHVSQEFEQYLMNEGAKYFVLNVSNDKNKKFWLRNGYAAQQEDESGNMIYIKRFH